MGRHATSRGIRDRVSRRQAVRRDHHRKEGRHVDRACDQGDVACIGKDRGSGPGTESDRRDQQTISIRQSRELETLGPSYELVESPETVRRSDWAEVFPLLDLIDVATIDVPQLSGAPMKRPVIVREAQRRGFNHGLQFRHAAPVGAAHARSFSSLSPPRDDFLLSLIRRRCAMRRTRWCGVRRGRWLRV